MFGREYGLPALTLTSDLSLSLHDPAGTREGVSDERDDTLCRREGCECVIDVRAVEQSN